MLFCIPAKGHLGPVREVHAQCPIEQRARERALPTRETRTEIGTPPIFLPGGIDLNRTIRCADDADELSFGLFFATYDAGPDRNVFWPWPFAFLPRFRLSCHRRAPTY